MSLRNTYFAGQEHKFQSDFYSIQMYTNGRIPGQRGWLLAAAALTQNAKFFGTKLKLVVQKVCGACFGALDPGGGFGHLLFCSSQPAGS